VHLVNFQSLVVGAGDHQGSICRKAHCLDWGGVALNNLAEAFNRVLPNANGLVG
jgi:hypothetical protein